MSYARMTEAEQRPQAEAERLLQEAEAVDAAEDVQYGRGRRGDELPPELARRETRLAKIWAAKAALEAEAKDRARQAAEEARSSEVSLNTTVEVTKLTRTGPRTVQASRE